MDLVQRQSKWSADDFQSVLGSSGRPVLVVIVIIHASVSNEVRRGRLLCLRELRSNGS